MHRPRGPARTTGQGVGKLQGDGGHGKWFPALKGCLNDTSKVWGNAPIGPSAATDSRNAHRGQTGATETSPQHQAWVKPATACYYRATLDRALLGDWALRKVWGRRRTHNTGAASYDDRHPDPRDSRTLTSPLGPSGHDNRGNHEGPVRSGPPFPALRRTRADTRPGQSNHPLAPGAPAPPRLRHLADAVAFQLSA